MVQQEHTIGYRLRQVIGDDPGCVMSIRQFAGRMAARKPRPPGSTRAMIHRYLANTGKPPTPPSAFLAAAADVLDVRAEWLAFGIGHPTPLHALEEQAARAVIAEAPEHIMQDIRAGFASEADPREPGWLDQAGLFAVAALINAWRLKVDGYARALRQEWPADEPLLEADAGSRGHDTNVTAQIAHGIGAAARATLDALDVDYPRMAPEARSAFLLGLAQAIIATADAPPAPAYVLGVALLEPALQPRAHRRKSPKKKTAKKRTRKKRRS